MVLLVTVPALDTMGSYFTILNFMRFFRIFFVVSLTACFLASCTSEPSVRTSTVTKSVPAPVFGPLEAKTVVTFFSDFQCPTCIVWHQQIGKTLDEYVDAGKIRVEYKQFPLSFHKNAQGDALAALCAQAQGKYRPYASALYDMEATKEGSPVTDAERVALFASTFSGVVAASGATASGSTSSGVDANAFAQCLSEGHYVAQMQADMAEGTKRNIPGTPTVFVNGQMLEPTKPTSFITLLDGLIAENAKTK